jgi:hypothetical protein
VPTPTSTPPYMGMLNSKAGMAKKYGVR